MGDIDDLMRAISVIILLVARGYGVLLVLPPLLKVGQNWMLRFPLALAISLPAFPLAAELLDMQTTMGETALLAIRELGLGAITGLFFFPLFAVPRAAGTLVDQQAGLMFIQLLDPSSAERSSTLFADLFERCALFLFVSAGGLIAMSDLYVTSHLAWPLSLAHFPAQGDVTELIVEGLKVLLHASLVYGAPFVIVLFILEYGIAIIGKSAPQINILAASAPIKMLAATITLMLAMPFIVDSYSAKLGQAIHAGEHFFASTSKRD